MSRLSTSAVSIAAFLTFGLTFGGSAETATLPPEGTITSEQATFEVELVTGGLNSPWGMAFLPDGGMLVTERDGYLRLIENGELIRDPIKGVPDVYVAGQGGLLDVVLDPAFADNNLIYLSLSTTTAARARGSPVGAWRMAVSKISR